MLKKKIILLIAVTLSVHAGFAQVGPEVTSWILNTTGATGYSGYTANCQQIQYSTNNVYVTCSCIPTYTIGPWGGNPNVAQQQSFVYKFTRAPQQNTGIATAVGLGHIGVWSNGVSVFNALDAMSYNSGGIWHQNAIVVEGPGFDNCLGHPQQQGEYHHHLNPTCLYNDHDSSVHSPIIGYAFDGFPIYGAYAYSNTNGTGAITRMKSSYRMRNISDRTTLADGTILTSGQYGPAIGTQYPLGYYAEDFEYVPGLGDLDDHNGRFCVTPEYPAGTYAYFVTLDATLHGAYPYVLGLTYYGTVQAGNTGMNSGHNTVTETVTTYNPSNGIDVVTNKLNFVLYPNPTSDEITILIPRTASITASANIINELGQVVLVKENITAGVQNIIDISSLPSGIYFVKLQSGLAENVTRFLKN